MVEVMRNVVWITRPAMLVAILLSPCAGQAGVAAEAGVNVALASEGAVAISDSVYPGFQPKMAIDGKWVGPGDDPESNRLLFSVQRPHPHWLWIHFRQPARISRVVIHRSYATDHPVDFIGQCSSNGGDSFENLFEVTDHKMDAETFQTTWSFDPVVAQDFRLWIAKSALQDLPNAAQVSEVEVFGEFVEAKPKEVRAAAAAELPSDVLKPTQPEGLQIKQNDEEIEFRSPWLRLTVDRNRPQITFLSWDSLGRGGVEENLLRSGTQLSAGVPIFSQPESARPEPAVCEGNVVRYRVAFPSGLQARWELRVEADSVRMAVSWANADRRAFRMPPGIQLPFNLGVSSVAPFATPPPGNPAPLPMPCLLNGGKNGTILIEQTGGDRVYLDGHGRWDAFLIGDVQRREDGFYVVLPHARSSQIALTVKSIPVALPDVVEAEPRLWALPRHWINNFQYRPDVGLLSNNIVSTPCANCLFYCSDLAFFTPPLPGGMEAVELVRASADRWLADTSGYGNQDPFMDGDPSLLIACWGVIRVTGDLELLKRWIPLLEERAAHWKKRDVDGDGLYESLLSGNRGDWHGAGNAWDCINFGHEDAYCLALGYRALRCLADLQRLAGRPEQAKVYDTDADRIREAYVPTFLNPETGILAGWKSRDGELHDYWFTFINGLAITYGLVPDDLANQIMDRIQAKFKEVGYTRFELGLPWQLVPVHKNDYLPGHKTLSPQKEDGSDTFQIFVNGGAHAQSYYYIQALYKLGRREEAEAILWPMMASYAACRFQNGLGGGGELTKWDGTPSGYEGFLSHCYRGQLALFTGHYGIGFGPEGFCLEPWSPLKGKRVKLGLKYMGKIVEEIE
ncbi:MAG: hypothetical protein ABIP48_11035 [Planctomycetota bacterium]